MAEVDQKALLQFLLRMGDNTLVLGHRVSEWCARLCGYRPPRG